MIIFAGGVVAGVILACIGVTIAILRGWLVPRGSASTPADPRPTLMPVLPPGFVWEHGQIKEPYSSSFHFIRIRDLQDNNKVVCRDKYLPHQTDPEPQARVKAARELYRANLSKLPGADNPENLGWS